MLLGNTGDDILMRLLRHRALAKGLILNEYGMGERAGDEVSLGLNSANGLKRVLDFVLIMSRGRW